MDKKNFRDHCDSAIAGGMIGALVGIPLGADVSGLVAVNSAGILATIAGGALASYVIVNSFTSLVRSRGGIFRPRTAAIAGVLTTALVAAIPPTVVHNLRTQEEVFVPLNKLSPLTDNFSVVCQKDNKGCGVTVVTLPKEPSYLRHG